MRINKIFFASILFLLSFSAWCGDVLVVWNGVSDAQSYVVARSNDFVHYSNVGEFDAGIGQYQDIGLSPSLYAYKIMAVMPNGKKVLVTEQVHQVIE